MGVIKAGLGWFGGSVVHVADFPGGDECHVLKIENRAGAVGFIVTRSWWTPCGFGDAEKEWDQIGDEHPTLESAVFAARYYALTEKGRLLVGSGG